MIVAHISICERMRRLYCSDILKGIEQDQI